MSAAIIRFPRKCPVALCIYCSTENKEPSSEHVIAESLGAKLKLLPECVCKSCNNILGAAIDRWVRADLAPIVSSLRVEGKTGESVPWRFSESVDGTVRDFVWSGDGISAAEPRKLLSRDENSYEFRADSLRSLENARNQIAAKHPTKDVELTEIETRTPNLPTERVDEIDFTVPHWRRWAAKTCLNVIAHALGSQVARETAFDDLRDLALRGDDKVVTLTVGGLDTNNADASSLRAVHSIYVQTTSTDVAVVVTLFEFCGCQLRRTVSGLPATETRLTLNVRPQEPTSEST